MTALLKSSFVLLSGLKIVYSDNLDRSVSRAPHHVTTNWEAQSHGNLFSYGPGGQEPEVGVQGGVPSAGSG